MGSFLLLMRRELGGYFASPMAYVVLVPFLLLSGLSFNFQLNSALMSKLPVSFGDMLSALQIIVLLVAPLVTMRLIAEEKNRGTMETLMTAPVTEMQVVLSKFVAAVIFLQYLLAVPVLGYAVLISFHAYIDPGAILSAYVGMMLVGGVIFSIGILVSSLCSNQITAGIITLVISFMFTMAPVFFFLLLGVAGKEDTVNVYTVLMAVVQRLDLRTSVAAMMQGVLDSRDLVYFFSITFFFLYLTVRVMQTRRWR